MPADLHRGLDDTQLGRAGPGRGEQARLGLLDPPEFEEHEDVVQVGGEEEAAEPGRPEHALPVRDIQAASLLRANPAGRGEDLDRLPDDGAAGAEPGRELVLGGEAVTRGERELGDQLQDLIGHDLIARPVTARSAAPGISGRSRSGRGCRGGTGRRL